MGLLLISLALLALAAGACGGGDESSVAEGESAFVAMLGLIPDTPEAREHVVINDYRRLREITGARPPTDDRDVEAVRAYAEKLFGIGTDALVVPFTAFISGGPHVPAGWDGLTEVITQENVGFSFADIDLDIEAEGRYPSMLYYSAARGSFDPAASAHAVQGCSGCAPPDEVAEFEGVTYFSWGADDELNVRAALEPPSFDELGRSSRLAFQPEYVFRTYATEPMREMIAAARGGQSLAGDEHFRSAALVLEERGAYRVFLADSYLSVEEFGETIAGRTDLDTDDWPPDDAVFLLPYEVLAVGSVLEGTDRFYVVVLTHRSEDRARENVKRFERITSGGTSYYRMRPWNELFDEVEIEVRGRLLIARISGYSPMNAIFLGDALFVHE